MTFDLADYWNQYGPIIKTVGIPIIAVVLIQAIVLDSMYGARLKNFTSIVLIITLTVIFTLTVLNDLKLQ